MAGWWNRVPSPAGGGGSGWGWRPGWGLLPRGHRHAATQASRGRPRAGERAFRLLLPLLLACLLAAPAALAAVGDPAERLGDPALESRAQALGRELRCMVCQNQSIEDSDAGLARDLRRIVREQLSAGRSDDQVMRFVHERYGDFVLLRPRFSATTALLWATPALALGGGALLVLAMRRRAARAAAAEPAALSEAERARLRRIEDQERAA